MKRTKAIITLVAGLMASFNSLATSPTTTYSQPVAKLTSSQLIIEQGNGWAKVLPNVAADKQTLEAAGDTSSEDYLEADNFIGKELLAITTLGGLATAELNQQFVADKLAEYGYTYPVALADYNKPFGPLVLDPLAIEQVYNQSQSAVSTFGLNKGLMQRKPTNSVMTSLQGCNDSYRSKSFALNLTPQGFVEDYNIGDNVNLNLDVGFGGTGSANLEVFYKKDRWGWGFACITVGVDYRWHEIKVDATLDNTHLVLAGDAQYAYSANLLNKDITFLSTGGDFWVWIVQFDWEINFGMKVQVDLDVQAQATIGYSATIDGSVHIDWKCTGANCVELTPDVIDATVVADDSPLYGFQLDVYLKPKARVFANAQVDMFWGLMDLAEAGVAIEAIAPLRFHGYYGNTCGDGDGNGSNETVQAALLDWYVEIYAYWYIKWGAGAVDLNMIDLDLAGYQPSYSVDTIFEGTTPVWRKQLLFTDLLSNPHSTTLEPMIDFISLDENNASGQLVITPRPCYPFVEEQSYQIDWGNKVETVIVGAAGAVFENSWSTPGLQNVSVSLVTDTRGRPFDMAYSSTTIVDVIDPNAPDCQVKNLLSWDLTDEFETAMQGFLLPDATPHVYNVSNCQNRILPLAQTGETQLVTCDIQSVVVDNTDPTNSQIYWINYPGRITYTCGATAWAFSY